MGPLNSLRIRIDRLALLYFALYLTPIIKIGTISQLLDIFHRKAYNLQQIRHGFGIVAKYPYP